jgi:hypothetical protein
VLSIALADGICMTIGEITTSTFFSSNFILFRTSLIMSLTKVTLPFDFQFPPTRSFLGSILGYSGTAY